MNRTARLSSALLSLAGLLMFIPCQGVAAEPAPAFRLPPWKTLMLDNGMTVMLMERHQLPLVNLRWVLRSGGSVGDPAGGEGTAFLTAGMLRKGAGSRNATQLSEAIDFVGGHLDASASMEFAFGSGEFLARDLDLALSLLSDMLRNPSFPKAELAKMVRQETDAITEAKAAPNEVIERYFDRLLFGRHPYGRPTGGTESTLPKISVRDVVRFHRSHYVPNELILAVVGDFSAAELEPKVRRMFSGWARGNPGPTGLAAPPQVRGRHALVVEKPDATQTFFRLGNVGLARTNQDWLAVQVVNTLFGGRFTSLINSALRIQSGLTYGARSSFDSSLMPGAFAIGSYTRNDTTERALDLALEVMDKFQEQGISDEQLQSAQAYIKGQFGPTLETGDQLANALCEMRFYGLEADYYDKLFERIDAVSPADAKRVIKEYFPSKDFSIVLIGQAGVATSAAKKLTSEIERKAITAPGF